MTIAELIDALEKASGPSFALEQEIMALLEPERGENKMLPANYTASLDAALSLSERVLGRQACNIRLHANGETFVQIFTHPVQRGLDPRAVHRHPAIAAVIAILKAKQALEVQG